MKKTNKETSEGNQHLHIEIRKNRERIDNAQKLMLDGQLDMAEYRSIKSKYEVKITDIEAEMSGTMSRPSDYKRYLDFGFSFLQNVDRMYVLGSTAIKNQILCSIFSEKLVFEKNRYRTPVYHEGLSLIFNADKDYREIKKGQTPGGGNLSSVVAGTVPNSNQILLDLKAIGEYS